MWQEADLLAVNKPAGVASQGGDGLAGINLVDLARVALRSDNIAVLHRIDRNVSGIVLLARSPDAARAMSGLIARGEVERRYEAIVRGVLDRERTLRQWLRKDARDNHVQLIEITDEQAPAPEGCKLSITRIVPIEVVGTLLGRCTVVHAWPITGRSHQIRAQLASAGLPIVGDPKYGVAAKGTQRPLLHASYVRFTDPRSGKLIEISVEPPWAGTSLTQLRKR